MSVLTSSNIVRDISRTFGNISMTAIFESGKLFGLERLDERARKLLEQQARIENFAADTILFRPGKECSSFLWVLEGALRVRLVSDNGREITLYRVLPGQTCVLTTTCLISGGRYGADAITEEPLRAIVIPAGLFKELLATSETFRTLVFSSYGTRITGLITELAEMAFETIDQRLAHYLCAHSLSASVLATHQEVANELGTVREVVSRLLKEYERGGLVALRHMRIDILDETALQRIAQGGAMPGA